LLRDRKIHQQPTKRRDLHVFDFTKRALKQIEPFLEREKGMLLIVMSDCDDDFVEKFSGAIDDVEMTVGDRVEAAGIYSAANHLAKNVQRSTRLRKATAWQALEFQNFSEAELPRS